MKSLFSAIPLLGFCVLLMGASNCSTTKIRYESDRGFTAPYQAEVLEFPVLINGMTCKDMAGVIGACTKILSERQDIKFEVSPLAYSYNIKIRCSSQVNFNYEADVEGEQPHSVIMPKELYKDIPEFICAGRITPSDRSFVSSRFELRLRVFDEKYVSRGPVQVIKNGKKNYLNVGKNALYTYVYEDGKWSTYSKRPVVPVKDPITAKAFSESEIMRVNHYNY